MISIIIPYSVTSISDHAFYGCTGLTSATIPSSVTSIGSYAFGGCTSLTNITIPNSVTSIGESAFYDCTSLTSITIPSSVTSIGSYAFGGCSFQLRVNIIVTDYSAFCNNSITNIGFFVHLIDEEGNEIKEFIIPNDVTSIGFAAFAFCYGLTSVIIPNSVTNIGSGAFGYCSSLESVTIPNSVTSIGGSAFYGCTSLKSVNIPNSVTSIGGEAFFYCDSLESVTLGSGVLSIYSGVFSNHQPSKVIWLTDTPPSGYEYAEGKMNYVLNDQYTLLNNKKVYSYLNSIIEMEGVKYVPVNLSENTYDAIDCLYEKEYNKINIGKVTTNDGIQMIVNNVNDYSFYSNSYLNEVSLGESIKIIGKNAFDGCSNIKTMEIGSNVTFIGYKAFAGSNELTDVTCKATSIPITDRTAFDDSGINYATLHVPAVSITSYQETRPWSGFNNIVRIVLPTHTLTYKVDGENYKTYQIEEGETITPEPEPSKEGHTFSGWSEIPETMPDHDVTVTGTFSINSYVLTYLLNGEIYKQQKLEFGTVITPESDITQEGHTFSGWSETPTTMPAHDVTIIGTLTVNKYILTYILDGQEYKTMEVEYGTVITPEPDPEKEGYTFSGWIGLPETMPAKFVIVTGTFSINSYTLTYMIGDELYKQVVYEYGAAITPEPTPEGDYISFEWVGVPETMPAHDVTVTAVYETGIRGSELIMMNSELWKGIYTPNGKRIDKLQKGLNIVVMQDGTIKKIVVK